MPDLYGAACGGRVKAKKAIELSSSKFFEIKPWFISDVAEYTGYSKGTLYNLTSKNLIPHKKKRGKLYFVPFEIQNWIEEGDLK